MAKSNIICYFCGSCIEHHPNQQSHVSYKIHNDNIVAVCWVCSAEHAEQHKQFTYPTHVTAPSSSTTHSIILCFSEDHWNEAIIDDKRLVSDFNNTKTGEILINSGIMPRTGEWLHLHIDDVNRIQKRHPLLTEEFFGVVESFNNFIAVYFNQTFHLFEIAY